MGYYIDLKNISIDEYKHILKSTDLLPSWKILGEEIDSNLNCLKNIGIENLEGLLKAMKSKSQLQEVSDKSGLSIEYLTVLRRVVNGYLQRPNRFRDFPNLDNNIVKKLESIGIKNTLNLYEKVLTPIQRADLSTQLKLPIETIDKLAGLTELSRIKWVNHTFAYMLYESGFRSVSDIANADYNDLYESIKKFNKKHEVFKGNIGLNDMRRVLDSAQMLEIEIQY